MQLAWNRPIDVPVREVPLLLIRVHLLVSMQFWNGSVDVAREEIQAGATSCDELARSRLHVVLVLVDHG